MVWLIKTRNLRRPLSLVGAACVSAFVGVCVINKCLSPPAHLHPSRCTTSCANHSKYPSYNELQKYQATKLFEDSVVKKLDVVFLGSNSPIEDRFAVGVSENLGAALVSVIDGHKGTQCSQYLQENILQHISSHLHDAAGKTDDLKLLMDMDSVLAKTPTHRPVTGIGTDNCGIKPEKIRDVLKESFVSLDDKISEIALKDMEAVLSGQSLDMEMKLRILTALNGACALAALIQRKDVYVASTGDCRIVLGRKHGKGGKGKWEAIPLSVDQNVFNEEEVKRLQKEHPGEDETSIIAGRVLGSLMPFRSFGDVDYKWDKLYLKSLSQVPLFYKTPPYVTAEPVLTRHRLEDGDKFLIIASDGLWERMTNEKAVNIVSNSLSSSHGDPERSTVIGDGKNPPSFFSENASTDLLWHALGGKESTVSNLLRISPKISRQFRDDITIMVVYL